MPSGMKPNATKNPVPDATKNPACVALHLVCNVGFLCPCGDRAILSPAVPADASLLRTSYMATHTDAQMERVLEVFARQGEKYGLI